MWLWRNLIDFFTYFQSLDYEEDDVALTYGLPSTVTESFIQVRQLVLPWPGVYLRGGRIELNLLQKEKKLNKNKTVFELFLSAC